MKFVITGRKIEVTDGLRSRIENKIGKLDKFFSNEVEAFVTLKAMKEHHTVEVMIPLPGGVSIRAEVTTEDMYTSIDHVVQVLEGQIRKNKTKIQKRTKETVVIPDFTTLTNPVSEETEYDLVRTKTIPVKPMFVEEAILQMNLLGHSFFVFSNAAEKEKTCVVYRRNDGKYGLIIPQ